MAFDYDPNDCADDGSDVQGGNLPFKVDVAEDTVFKTGSTGWKVQLLAGTEKTDVRVYVNFVNTPKALWKFREFCASVGKDFDNPPKGGWKPAHFEGLLGRAMFHRPDKYLEVDQFLPAGDGPADDPPPPTDDDAVPF